VELRARTGTLMASAAITTSFLGSQTFDRRVIGPAAWIGVACFVLLGFTVLLVLWPRRDFVFSLAPDELIATYLEPPDAEPFDLHMIKRDLALHMGDSARLNRRQLRVLTAIFRVGALLLVAEVLAWVVALIA